MTINTQSRSRETVKPNLHDSEEIDPSCSITQNSYSGFCTKFHGSFR